MLRYFAYGSNMLAARLQRRCVTARIIASAVLAGYKPAFCKVSVDGSAKATLQPSSHPGALTYGVIYELAHDDLANLDRIEGLNNGYRRLENVTVHALHDRRPHAVTTYIAEAAHCDDSLRPYDWYLDLVVMGARHAGLPETYCSQLASVVALSDPMTGRLTRQEALKVLEKS